MRDNTCMIIINGYDHYLQHDDDDDDDDYIQWWEERGP